MWRWVLTYNGDSRELEPEGNDAPVGYKNLALIIKKTDFNNFIVQTSNKIDFTTEIKDWILELIETNGPDINIDIAIYRKKLSTQDFEEIITGKSNLTDLLENRDTITINIEQTSFELTFNNRKNDKIEINAFLNPEKNANGPPQNNILGFNLCP